VEGWISAEFIPMKKPDTRRKAPGRNDPCHCGSGKKFKHCCEVHSRGNPRGTRFWLVVVAGIVAAAIGMIIVSVTQSDSTAPPGQVWSSEHGHYH
jgi:hypothetical protein